MTPHREPGLAGAGEVPLSVILGRCDDMRAEVFVRAAVPASAGRLTLTGTLTGPRCRRSITLPVTARLEDLPPSAGAATGSGVEQRGNQPAVARAILTEPSFWTPELPNLYRLEARLRCDEGDVPVIDRMVGLRRLGVRGRSFWFDGRRWVPRCVPSEALGNDPLSLAAVAATAWIVDPDEASLAVADEAGVAVVAVLPAAVTADAAASRIAGWSLHAAVVGVVCGPEMPAELVTAVATEARGLKGTMLLGLSARGDLPPVAATPGVDFLVVVLEGDALPHEGWRNPPSMPLLALRRSQPASSRPDVAAARLACNRLQADLAAWGLAGGGGRLPWDWAGYAVT